MGIKVLLLISGLFQLCLHLSYTPMGIDMSSDIAGLNADRVIFRANSYLNYYKFLSMPAESIHQCIQICFYWSLCKSVNFYMGNRTCSLNCKTEADCVNCLVQMDNVIYTDTTVYPSVVAGSCVNHNCPDIHMCVPDTLEEFKCVPIQNQNVINLHALHYNFDEGLCGWSQSYADDDDDWLLNKGKTQSIQTGPNGDHTTGNGYYLYIEASNPRRHGDKSRLISDALPALTNTQIDFWYHMWTNRSIDLDVGTLNVYYKYAPHYLYADNMLFTVTGDQGNVWHQQRLAIPPQARTFIVIFEGIVGRTVHSDICIDDITIRLES